MELSQNVEDERTLKRELSAMGVRGIAGLDTLERSAAGD